MPDQKLTKRIIDSARPKAERYTIHDSEVTGFGLRVSPTGSKSYVFEYRSVEGGRQAAKMRITIGKSTDFTPDEARKIADQLRSRTKVGEDPQSEKMNRRQAPTLAEIAEQFLSKHVGPKRKAGTKAHYEDIINRILCPALGSRKAKDVTRSEVARLHLDWAHTPFQANRILAILSSVYSFAGKHGLVPEGINPAKGIEKYKEDSRERYLSSDELVRLGAAIREAETVGIPWNLDQTKISKHTAKSNQFTVIGEHAAAAIRILLFTGARLREVLHLRWENVDLERGILFLQDSKTGKKPIILNAPAIEVLQKLKRIGVYVIASDTAGTSREKPRADLKRPWAMIRQRAGLADVRIHDLRHNFAAFGAGGGMGLPIIGKLLGHTQMATTQRYAHLDADPLRRASNSIGSSIAAAMGERSNSATILKLPSSRKNSS